MNCRSGVAWLVGVCVMMLAMDVRGQTPEASQRGALDELAKARLGYEVAMDELRVDIGRALDASRGKKGMGSRAAIELTQQLDSYREVGALPSEGDFGGFAARYGAERKKLDEAYGDAILACSGLANPRLCGELESESQVFLGTQDLAPWREVGIEKVVRVLQQGGSLPLVIPRTSGFNYRLEIKGHCEGEGGGVRIAIPIAPDRQAEVVAAADKDRNVRVLLTVGNGRVATDLGVARPANVQSSQMEKGTEIGVVLRATDGPMTLDSVRFKPIVFRWDAEAERLAGERVVTKGRSLQSVTGKASFFGVEATGSRFLYIVDVSGSMGISGKIEFLRSELLQSVEGMSEGAEYLIVPFSGWALPLGDKKDWTRADDQGRRFARKFVPALRPLDNTNPIPAFDIAFAVRPRPDAIFFMTDGEFDAAVADMILELNRGLKIPVHCICLGSKEAESTMQRIAKESGGMYKFKELAGTK